MKVYTIFNLIEQAFNICYAFNNVEQPVQLSTIFGTHVEANVETVLNGPNIKHDSWILNNLTNKLN